MDKKNNLRDMKKLLLSSLLVGSMICSLPMAAQEVTYVEDCAQGLLLNPNHDNWFITARGGANFSFGKYDMRAPFKDRIGSTASIFAGKWLTPTFGLRFGFNMTESKGATYKGGPYQDEGRAPFSNGYYPKKYFGWGVEVDGMVNMTNWIRGYRPNRFYNLVLHGGAGSIWCLYHDLRANGDRDWRYEWHNRVFYINLGLQNNFNIGKGFDVFVDVEGQINDWPRVDYIVNLTAGITYNFKKREWNCPVTAVCPTWKYTDAEGDALTAQLGAAEDKIADLQNQLDNCRKRPAPAAQVAECDGLATVYYPINVYSLGKREMGILTAVAQVMKDHPDTRYKLTGWADNYTGNETINVRLRQNRVAGVKKFLVGLGVNADQLETGIDNTDLTNFGPRSASLDRAVTIKEIK